jgi:hypothetical protein
MARRHMLGITRRAERDWRESSRRDLCWDQA